MSPSTIETYVEHPLNTEKTRLFALSEVLTSTEDEIRSLLSSLGVSDEAIADTSVWLEKAVIEEGESNRASLLEAFQVQNKLQAELSARKPGLESSLRLAQWEMRKLEDSGGSPEAIEKVKRKIVEMQKLVDR